MGGKGLRSLFKVPYRNSSGVGSALKVDNRRGQIALYVSFMEFGTFLQDESAWLPLGVCRTDIKKAVGASAITRAVVRKLFLERGEHGFVIGGAIFHYRLHRCIADSAANETLRYKGASGWKVRLATMW